MNRGLATCPISTVISNLLPEKRRWNTENIFRDNQLLTQRFIVP